VAVTKDSQVLTYEKVLKMNVDKNEWVTNEVTLKTKDVRVTQMVRIVKAIKVEGEVMLVNQKLLRGR
jgi:hypothetical protein